MFNAQKSIGHGNLEHPELFDRTWFGVNNWLPTEWLPLDNSLTVAIYILYGMPPIAIANRAAGEIGHSFLFFRSTIISIWFTSFRMWVKNCRTKTPHTIISLDPILQCKQSRHHTTKWRAKKKAVRADCIHEYRVSYVLHTELRTDGSIQWLMCMVHLF